MTYDYETWYDKIGWKVEEYILEMWNGFPEVFVKQFRQDYIDDKVQDALIEAYESYVSEYEDMAYENFKESRMSEC